MRYGKEKRFVAEDKNLGPGFNAFMPRLEVSAAGMTELDWFSLGVLPLTSVLHNFS